MAAMPEPSPFLTLEDLAIRYKMKSTSIQAQINQKRFFLPTLKRCGRRIVLRAVADAYDKALEEDQLRALRELREARGK